MARSSAVRHRTLRHKRNVKPITLLRTTWSKLLSSSRPLPIAWRCEMGWRLAPVRDDRVFFCRRVVW